jgi:hypothetical protein
MKNNVINKKFAIGQKLLAKIKINYNYIISKYFAQLLFKYENYTLNFNASLTILKKILRPSMIFELAHV